ncbi:MAG: sigma 54-interacting transcriptional regulator [Gemmatimonadaceae bacterium]
MIDDLLAELIVGQSPAMRELRARIGKVAPVSLPVLIQGPTGAGKELVAEALHVASGRAGHFVPFNVSAIPETMFEDTLFGHVRGSFTGATQNRRGYLGEANSGTLFLDEIGSLPLPVQPKLLRAIESGKFRAVGSAKDETSCFRVVAATSEDLVRAVRRGAFRADLVHRLMGLVIVVPALRDRLDDVPLLARHIAGRVAASHRVPAELSDGAIAMLQRHSWPGNVRELKHVVEAAIALATTSHISARDVQDVLANRHERRGSWLYSGDSEERRTLTALLDRCEWDTKVAAERLQVHRSTLYRRMERLGIPAQRWRESVVPDVTLGGDD